MSDEEYEATVTELIRQTVSWARRKYNVRASSVIDPGDLEGELWIAALNKRDKLEPRLEAGEVGYVVTTLRRAAHDALEPEWARQAKDGGTLDDLEAISDAGSPRADGAPRTVARRNPQRPPVAIQRIASKAADRALKRKQRDRAAAVLMTALDPVDREILRLHLGGRPDTGAKPAAIALEVGLSEKTVYRRLAGIMERLQNPPTEKSEPLLLGDG